MENLGQQSDRKRIMKFEANELKVLVEEANKHIAELQQRNLNITGRNVMKLRKDGKIYERKK